MHAYRADGIIDMQLHVERLDNDNDEDTRYDTDDCRADRVKGVTPSGHAD